MELKLLYLWELEEKRWEALLFNSQFSTFYHKSSWAKLWFSSFVFFTPLFMVLLDYKGDYLAGFPFILSDKYRVKRAYSMPYGTYGGLVTRENLLAEEIKELYEKIEEHFKELKAIHIEVVDFFGTQNILSEFGYKADRGYTHILDLSRYSVNPVHKIKRGAIQAERKGVRVVSFSSAEKIRQCYELIQKRDKHYGLKKSKYPLGLYENIFNLLSPEKDLLWRAATAGDQIIAFQINFLFKDTIYYWEGASNFEALNLRPNDALFSDTIQWGLSQGYRFYNLGGSPEDAEGLVRFKEAWGGVKKDYPIYSRRKFWYRIAQNLKRIL